LLVGSAFLLAAAMLGWPQLPGAAAPADPYKAFEYRLRFDSSDIAGFREYSARYGTGSQSISLDGGESYDAGFTSWAADWVKARGGQAVDPAPARRSIVVATLDDAGKQASAAQFGLCLVDEFQAVPDPSKGKSAVSVLHVHLTCGYPRLPSAPR